MKRKLICVCMAAALLVAPCAFAQYDSGSQSQMGSGSPHEHGGMKHNVDDHVKKLTKELNLNADQQKQVRSILEDQHKQMESLRSDSSMSKQDRHAKFEEMHQASHQKIRDILTPDQQKKFDTMQEKHGDHMKKEGGEKQ